jgi:hypothetical protein
MPAIIEMTSHLRTLSLKAPWNCVTISAQKPFVAFGFCVGIFEWGSFIGAKLTTSARKCELKNLAATSFEMMLPEKKIAIGTRTADFHY